MPAVKMQEIADMTGGELLCGDGSLVIEAYSTDSRKVSANTLFIPVIGENVDAHDYIKDAYKNGCRATFTSRDDRSCLPEGMTCIKVDNNVFALQRLAEAVRKRFQLPIVGITGSVGKTTTKEMIAAALSTELEVLKTHGNMNSQVSLPQMILKLEDKYQIGVIELGMSQVGEMERIVRVARPNTAVITNIGLSHIGQLGSKENILKEKLRILDCMSDNGLVLVNGNDELLSKLKSDCDVKALYPCTIDILKKLRIESFGTNEACTHRAENLVIEGEYSEFTYRGYKIKLNVGGSHNVLNALAALAVAQAYGVPTDKAAEGLANYKPANMRGEIKKIRDFTLLDDAYNASPDSMRASLDIFMGIKAERHIAILADILELGELSGECHRAVGRMAAEHKVDVLFTIGNEAHAIAKAARELGNIPIIREFDSNLDAYKELVGILKTNDAIMVKGSRGMRLEEITGWLIENKPVD